MICAVCCAATVVVKGSHSAPTDRDRDAWKPCQLVLGMLPQPQTIAQFRYAPQSKVIVDSS